MLVQCEIFVDNSSFIGLRADDVGVTTASPTLSTGVSEEKLKHEVRCKLVLSLSHLTSGGFLLSSTNISHTHLTAGHTDVHGLFEF